MVLESRRWKSDYRKVGDRAQLKDPGPSTSASAAYGPIQVVSVLSVLKLFYLEVVLLEEEGGLVPKV